MLFPVVLCGGSGTRLWPLSRDKMPKQFVRIKDQTTLFFETIKRVRPLVESEQIVIVSNNSYRFYVQNSLSLLNCDASVILEPSPKNTAPAVALAAFSVLEKCDGVLLVVPSDHVFIRSDFFKQAVTSSLPIVSEGYMVTFGIEPSEAKTGYGYIKLGNILRRGIHKAEKFIEKPDIETARDLLKQRGYYWNSGVFCFKASTYLSELKRYSPKIYEWCELSWHNRKEDLSFIRPSENEFLQCPRDSIDFAIMEKTQRLTLVPLSKEVGWNDMGSWGSLYEVSEKDENQNVLEGDVVERDCHDCYIKSTDRLVAAVGLENLAIVETKDSVLVIDKEKDQQVKAVVEQLKFQKRKEYSFHSLVYRPWGFYEVLVEAAQFLVKKICVYPGEAISLQLHNNRSEHWIIVEGVAEVTCGDKNFTLIRNKSTFIPKKTKHRIENHQDKPLVFVEVQTGSNLDENDIVRFEDKYGRIGDKR